MKRLRWIVFAAWLACLALRLCLPTYDVCWHRDGSVCDEAVPQSCCEDGAQDAPAGEDCADCTDLHLKEGTGAVRGAAVPLLASAKLPVLAAALPPIACELPGLGPLAAAPGVAPPGPPGLRRSLPIRC